MTINVLDREETETQSVSDFCGEGLWREDPVELTFEAEAAEGQSCRKQRIPPVSFHYSSKAGDGCFFLCEE